MDTGDITTDLKIGRDDGQETGKKVPAVIILIKQANWGVED